MPNDCTARPATAGPYDVQSPPSTGNQYIDMIVPNQRNRALGAATRLAASAAGYLASNALNGSVSGLGQRIRTAAQRYMRGDPNQPATANTTQQLRTMRPARISRRRAAGGGATIVERGSLKLADVTTPGTVATGTCVASLPLQTEVIGGRLFAMSKLYSRWKFMSALLRYVPAVSSATDGSLVVYYSQEPDEVYSVGEAVGANNAASAIDNMEFSVREKMNMPLHVNPQLLFTSPSASERTWHSAGTVNVINNGALVANKTYGSLYMDFVVCFSQPCAPYDPYGALFSYGTWSPSGAGSTGSAASNIFSFSTDSTYLSPASGQMWLVDPATGNVNTHGKIYLPPYSSASVAFIANDSSKINAPITQVLDPGVVFAVGTDGNMSADFSMKTWRGIVTNTTGSTAGFSLRSGAAGFALFSSSLDVNQVPFKV